MEVEKRLEKLKEILENPDFLARTMEVPFYVFDYDVEDEPVVEYYLERIMVNPSKDVCKVDLFNTLIDVLKEAEYIEYLFGRDRKEILENIYSFIPDVRDKILEMSQNCDVLFITGVGKAYPFLRVPNFLKDIESSSIPVVVFYPGYFDGRSFLLFGRLHDGVYYRAKPIVDREWGDHS